MEKLKASLRSLLGGLARLRKSKGAYVTVYAISLFVFALILTISIRNSKIEVDQLSVPYLLAFSLISYPATLLTIAMQIKITALLTGLPLRTSETMAVTFASIAANALPIPGSVVVRTGFLKTRGVSLRDATGASISVGMSWLAWSSFAVGALVVLTSFVFGVLFLCVAIAAALGGALLVPPLGRTISGVLRVQMIGLQTMLVLAVNQYFAYRSLGFQRSIYEATVISTSSAFASIVGLVPSGLGLREAIGSALAQLVDSPSAEAVLSISLGRFVGIGFLSLFGLTRLLSHVLAWKRARE